MIAAFSMTLDDRASKLRDARRNLNISQQLEGERLGAAAEYLNPPH